jgi:TetR/AcrR family transcriptional regulator
MDKRTEILSCALSLFSKRGYDAVGIQEIVERAGVTKPTLYYYFKSKKGLFEGLLEYYYGSFLESLEAVPVRNSKYFQPSLEAIVESFFAACKAQPDFFRLRLSLDFLPRENEVYPAVMGYSTRVHRLILPHFTACSADYRGMRGRESLFAATFIGMIHTYISLQMNGFLDFTDEIRACLVRSFLTGVRR